MRSVEIRELRTAADQHGLSQEFEALLAERDALAKEILRLRVAAAKAAQRADGWPDSNDDPADCLNDCASILYDALDVRHVRNDAAMEDGNE